MNGLVAAWRRSVLETSRAVQPKDIIASGTPAHCDSWTEPQRIPEDPAGEENVAPGLVPGFSGDAGPRGFGCCSASLPTNRRWVTAVCGRRGAAGTAAWLHQTRGQSARMDHYRPRSPTIGIHAARRANPPCVAATRVQETSPALHTCSPFGAGAKDAADWPAARAISTDALCTDPHTTGTGRDRPFHRALCHQLGMLTSGRPTPASLALLTTHYSLVPTPYADFSLIRSARPLLQSPQFRTAARLGTLSEVRPGTISGAAASLG